MENHFFPYPSYHRCEWCGSHREDLQSEQVHTVLDLVPDPTCLQNDLKSMECH